MLHFAVPFSAGIGALFQFSFDFWASLEHTIRYKKNLPINTEVETELKECADSSREWDGKMEHLLHILT